MRAILFAALAATLILAGAPGTERAGAADDAVEIDIQISPGTVALDSYGTWVTVHADISYWSVATVSLYLDGIPVRWTKADSRGDLVAKFALDDVKAILSPGTATLTLVGSTKAGMDFVGTDTIGVTSGSRK